MIGGLPATLKRFGVNLQFTSNFCGWFPNRSRARLNGSRAPKRSCPCCFWTVMGTLTGRAHPTGRAQGSTGRVRVLNEISPNSSSIILHYYFEAQWRLKGGREELYGFWFKLISFQTLFQIFLSWHFFKIWKLLILWFPFALKLVELMFFLKIFAGIASEKSWQRGLELHAGFQRILNFYNFLQKFWENDLGL